MMRRLMYKTLTYLLICSFLSFSICSCDNNKGKKRIRREVDSTVLTSEDFITEHSTESIDSQVDNVSGTKPHSSLQTGTLSVYGNGYEGIEGTGEYNYGEALQKSILFYELQRSGYLPDEVRCNWRSDSCLNDGNDVGIDLTGGLYDAGDHVKFNLPMAYTSAMLGWSVYEDYESYDMSGQLQYMLDTIKWINDYLIKCHPEDEVFYYQVGNGGTDHSWWGPVEVMNLDRPSYCVTRANPGSAVTAQAAASLAVASILYEQIDSEYSQTCLEHARSLYEFSDSTRSDSGYVAANGFYDSWSGFYDELAWAGTWLYIATDEQAYLDNAKACYSQANSDYNWAMCWDDVHIGAALLLARITSESTYIDAVEKHLDYWSCGTSSGERITYTPEGLAWLDSWGSLRYATTTAFLACVYGDWEGCPSEKRDIYWDFAESQVEYALGSTGFSYMIGYGESYPVHPHHRTSQGSYCDNMGMPSDARHILWGALVGGPDANDNYVDEVSNYNTNEVACDYNAGFTGLLAKFYGRYYGQTLIDFGAVEEININEFYSEGSVNASGNDFIELKTIIYNMSAWPARTGANLEYRYFIDLSEVFENGGLADDIVISTNYMQNGTYNGLYAWDEDAHIYYISVVFDDSLAPRSQSDYKSELQIRISNPGGVFDCSNDPSYPSLNGSDPMSSAIYEHGVLIWGKEPGDSGANAGITISPGSSSTTPPSSVGIGGFASDGDISINVRYDSCGSTANSISGTIDITNESSSSINLDSLLLEYYVTNSANKTMVFDTYHCAINESNGTYTQLTNITSTIDKCSGTDCDTLVSISYGTNGSLPPKATLTLSFGLHYSDWSIFDSSDDYSAKSLDNIVVTSNSEVVYGNKP